MERIVMEGTPLTLEERIERQANEIRTKEQQIEQLKAENDHWQEVCADLHIEYGEQIEAQQQEITNYLKVIEQQRDTLARDSDSFNKQQQEIESLKRELNAEISVNEALTADKDAQVERSNYL